MRHGLRRARRTGLARALRIPVRELAFRLHHPQLGRRVTRPLGPGGDGHRDERTRIAVVEEALGLIPVEAHAGAFADVGCATGRVLHVAARHPYLRLIGVELDPALAAVARAHLDDPRAEIVVADAATWPIPDDLSVAYLFNPFGPATTGALLEALVRSQADVPRPVYLCDVHGVHAEHIAAAGFEVVARAPQIVLWRRAPEAPAATGSVSRCDPGS